MATTRPTLASLARQTERLLVQAGLCPQHPRERLWCGPCHLSWEGTPHEFDELVGLAERLPYNRHPGPTPYRCASCQERLWCDACFRAEMARLPSREVTMPLSDEELARYHKLSAYLAFKEHSGGLPMIRLHWGDPKPQEATEPEPPRVSTEQTPCSSSSPEAPELEPATAPVPASEDGDDADQGNPSESDLEAQLEAIVQALRAQVKRG
jgi:hypothetical protein